jgi:hypothetical protein
MLIRCHGVQIGGYFVWWWALMEQAVPVAPTVAGQVQGSSCVMRPGRGRDGLEGRGTAGLAGSVVPLF